MNRAEQIEIILNEWFSLEVIRNKNLELRYKINNRYLEAQCKYLHNKYSSLTNYHTFVSNYITHTYQALTKLDDLSDINNASKYCYKSNNFSLMEELNPKQTIKMDGRRIPLKFNSISLDYLTGEEETELNLLDILTEKDNLFHNPSNQTFFNKHFLEWFADTKHTFLTQSQLEFLDNLNSLSHDASYKEIKEVTKTDPRNLNDKIYRIANRIILEYQLQNIQPISQYQKELIYLVRLFETIKNLSNRDDNLSTQNQDLFTYITSHFDELQPHLSLTLEEHQAVNRKQYNSCLLYKICNQCIQLYYKNYYKLQELIESKEQPSLNSKPSLAKSKTTLPNDTKTAIIINFDGSYVAE